MIKLMMMLVILSYSGFPNYFSIKVLSHMKAI